MPLDTASIIGNIKPVQLGNPLDVQGKVMNLSALRDASAMNQMKLDEARQEQEGQRTLSDLCKSHIDPATGKLNRAEFLSGAAQRGVRPKTIQALQKSFTDEDKATADVGHVQAQTQREQIQTTKAKLDISNAAISSLLTKANVTEGDVVNTIVGLVNNGVVNPQAGEVMVKQVGENRGDLRSWLIAKGFEGMDAAKRMEMALPKTEVKDNGGAFIPVQTNQITGQVTAGAPIANKVQSPDSVATTGIARERLNFDKAQGANQFIPVDGVGVFVGNKATGEARPLMGPDGQPIKPQKALNQDQSNALLFGSRMRDADKVIGQLEKLGVATPSIGQQATGGSGLTGSLATASATPQQQQVEQAQRDFINATLRRESGASISPSEFDNARKQYFVQIGDSPEVVAQKARNRKLATSGMLMAVPEGQRNSLQQEGGGGAPAVAPGIDADAIAAEIARRQQAKGGK